MQPGDDNPLAAAEEVYAEWCCARDLDGDKTPFDRLCAQHPRLAIHLRQIHADFGRLSSLAAEEGFPSVFPASASATNTRDGTIVDVDAELGPSSTILQSFVERIDKRPQEIGKYHVRRQVGEGSMGTVFSVYDEDLRRDVALKLMAGRVRGYGRKGSVPASPVDQRTLMRFVEEAQVTAQLDHPNIVPVHDFGVTSSGKAYFTMKLVKGRELKEVIENVHRGDSGWTLTRALGVLLKACEALSYAHDKGVVHRDLKPANIMVGRFGAVYVMDWGLARLVERDDPYVRLANGDVTVVAQSNRNALPVQDETDPLRTQDGDAIGTPLYMAPEQAMGLNSEVGPQSDVYGLGAILYHLLAGIAPYARTDRRVTAQEVRANICAGPPRSLHEIAPDVPKELRNIATRAMERELDQRYRTVADLAEDLIAFIEGRIVDGNGPRSLRRVKRWVTRNPATAGLLVVASVLLFVLAADRGRNIEAAEGSGSRETLERLVRAVSEAGSQEELLELKRAATEAKESGRPQDIVLPPSADDASGDDR